MFRSGDKYSKWQALSTAMTMKIDINKIKERIDIFNINWAIRAIILAGI